MPTLVVEAGCVTKVSTEPRLTAMTAVCSASTTRAPAAIPPRTSKLIMPPKPRICRWAMVWPGCSGRPG